jgi:hypothetical protein
MTDKAPWYILRNSVGRPDGLWTMAWVSFLIWCLYAVSQGLLGGTTAHLTTAIAGVNLDFNLSIPKDFDWASLTGLSPTWAAYIIRRHKIWEKTS